MKITIFCALFLLYSCEGKKSNESKALSLKTININMGIHGSDTTYSHFVIVENIESSKMLSISLDKLLKSYLDTASFALPITRVNFYSSDEGFVPDQLSQDWDKINKNHILSVSLQEDGINYQIVNISFEKPDARTFSLNINDFNKEVKR